MRYIIIAALLFAVATTSGCLGYRINPNKVKQNDPEFYEEWKNSLKDNGMTDEELKAFGIEE